MAVVLLVRLFPCKSEAIVSTISKQYADQASGNMNWFVATYGKGAKGTPVIVHPSKVLAPDAFPPEATRIMAKDELAKLHKSCIAFATAIKDDLASAQKAKGALAANFLMGDLFVKTFTAAPKKVA